jgi:hypothetical protein
MGFWEKQAAKAAECKAAEAAERQAHRDAWLDVEPALCTVCDEIRRGVLLGICSPCLEAWEAAG